MPTTDAANPGDAFDCALARERATLTEADRRRAVLTAGRAAALVAGALPGTHTLIFGYVEDGTWFGTTLEAVRDPGGALLWFGDLLADTADAASLVYSGRPAVTYFDERTNTAIDEALSRPEDLSQPHFRPCTITGADPSANPGDDASQLVALDVPAAIRAAEQTLSAAAITFDELTEPDDDATGGLAAHLSADETECALRTLAELWDGADREQDLGRPQQVIAGRLAQLRRAHDA